MASTALPLPAASERPTTGVAPSPTRRRRVVPATPGGRLGFTLIGVMLLIAAAGPLLVTVDPAKQALTDRFAPPVFVGGSWQHPLGTDQLGRDLLARIVTGARVSLAIGLVATMLAGTVGVTLGLLAGYAGGRLERVVTFLADVQLALPFVIVAIGVVAVFGNSLRNVVLVLALTGWVAYARIVRLQASSLRSAAFVDAARAAGATRRRIIARHVLPNLAGPIVVIASQQIAAMMLYEAALSYLGLGVPRGTITWGGLVANGRESLLTAWWVATIPGIAIALTILGLNLAGDWLQDRLSPGNGNV